MRKIALITLISLPLLADFFPKTVQTSLANISGTSVTLSSSFPVNGMSGVIVHNYGSNLEAITSRIIQKSPSDTILEDNDIVHHDQLPTINTAMHTGDKVIGGYLYNNILLLAPDASTYAQITANYNKKWVHPDLFALYLSKVGDTIPTKENLKTFAKSYQVGLIFIINKGFAKLLDPISGEIVATKPIQNLPSKGKTPFYMRFDKIKSGIFSSSNKQSYYQIMDNLSNVR